MSSSKITEEDFVEQPVVEEAIPKSPTDKQQKAELRASNLNHNCIKTFAIIFLGILFIFFTYLLAYNLYNTPLNQWLDKYLDFIAFGFRLISIPFVGGLLMREESWGLTLTPILILIYSIFEIMALLFSIYVMDYRPHIYGLVIQLIVVYLVLILSFTAFLRRKTVIDMENTKKLSDTKKRPETSTETKTAEMEAQLKAKREKDRLTCLKFLSKNFMAFSAMISIILTITVGLFLRWVSNKDESKYTPRYVPFNQTHSKAVVWTPRDLKYLGFLGEIFLRVLNSLIVPLIVSSLIYALASMRLRKLWRIAIRICVYYLVTTIIAVIIGIVLVSVIRPGSYALRSNKSTNKSTVHLADVVLDIFRNLFTDNIIRSTFQTYRTNLTNPGNLTTKDLDHWKITGTYSDQTNILGLIIFSIVFGLTVGIKSKEWALLVIILGQLNQAVLFIIDLVVNFAPIGILFLVLPQIVDIEDIGLLFQSVGVFTVTVLLGLAIHFIIILPLIYWIFVRRNPFKFMLNMLPALTLAFGTSSSSATMPTTMRLLEENNFLNDKVVQFCIPVGASINMDGTALYEAVSAIYIAQYLGIPLSYTELLIVSITATLASIGAAGIPQAGLITIVIVLNAIGLPADEAAKIMIVDWFLDRFRTVVNVMGDAYGAGIVNHLIGKIK